MQRDIKKSFSFLTIVFSLSLGSFVLQAQELRLGILNTVGNETETEFFKQTTEQLKSRLFPTQLIITTYDLPGLERAIEKKELDFFISNPGFFASTQQKLDTTIIAAQKYPRALFPDKAMGSVFLVPSQEKDVTLVSDLKGKTACAVSSTAYGGLFIAYGDLLKRGYEPEHFFKRVIYTGYPMPNVFKFLAEDKCEVGIVRACLFEDLVSSGLIKANEFKVVEPKEISKEFSCQRSTDLYPGWIFAATKMTTTAEKKEVLRALFDMAAVNGNSWTVAGNLNELDDLYRKLKVGHYSYLRQWDWLQFAKDHWEVLSFILLIAFLSAIYTRLLEIQVKRKTLRLERVMLEKEKEHQAMETAKQHLADLEKVSLVGMLSSMIAHELRQPLAAIRNYAEGSKTILETKGQLSEDLSEALQELDSQAQKASSIIEHMRSLIKSRKLHTKRINLSEFIPNVVRNFELLGGGISPEIELMSDSSLQIEFDPVQLEIVLLNLLNNASEAIRHQKSQRKIWLLVQKKNEEISICVINKGKLENPDDLKDLFKIKRSTKTSGLGVGLAISSRIMEAYGGSLGLKQQEGKVFVWISIPIIKA